MGCSRACRLLTQCPLLPFFLRAVLCVWIPTSHSCDSGGKPWSIQLQHSSSQWKLRGCGFGTSQCVMRQSLLGIWGKFFSLFTNCPLFPLDVVLSGYDAWNCTCYLVTMRSSGLRTKPIFKDGTAGRRKEPGPLIILMSHKINQPYKCLHLRTLVMWENTFLLV